MRQATVSSDSNSAISVVHSTQNEFFVETQDSSGVTEEER